MIRQSVALSRYRSDSVRRFAAGIPSVARGDASGFADRIQAISQSREVRPGESVVLGESCAWFAHVEVGATKLVAYASAEREQIVAFHFAGDLVWVPARAAHHSSLIALSDTSALLFPAEELLALAQTSPDLSSILLERTLGALQRCREKAVWLGRKSAVERVAAFLTTMATRTGIAAGSGCRLELPMSRRDIADSLGLTIETVSRQFTELRLLGLIETHGRCVVGVRDPGRLAALAGNLPVKPA